jgi:hypothetical protein
MHQFFSVCCIFTGCRLVAASNTVASSASVFTSLLTGDYLTTNWTQSQSQVKVTLRLTASQSVSLGVEPPSGAHDQIFFTVLHLRSCFCWAPSLTRGRVCLFYMLLALASGVFLGSESLGTRDHILLFQTRDFPFRRFLRLAGSRWRSE